MATQESADIRQMTSSPNLLATPNPKIKPLSPPTQARVGSRSPTSIPSSPTSIHSSTSAIFERDIEPLPPSLVPSGYHLTSPAPSNPHRTARAKQNEAVDQAVPSVLSSAASALVAMPAPQEPPQPGSPAALHQEDPFGAAGQINIIAPSHILPTSALPSPTGRGSRSPSPAARHHTLERQPSLPIGMPGALPPSRTSNAGSPRLAPLTSGSPPAVQPPLPTVPSVHDQTDQHSKATNRLSFISYNDLLLSTPVATIPLAAITQPASDAYPPHLPAVEQQMSAPPALSSGSRSRPRSLVFGNHTIAPQRASMMLEKDIGGEWEREGLGRGLEERLEALLKIDPPPPATELKGAA